MEDPNDLFTMRDPHVLEEVANRTTQEDPIIMYLIVRESLSMSIGKTSAQCAHASQMLLLQFHKEQRKWESSWDPVYGPSQEDYDSFPSETKLRWNVFDKWLCGSFRKVVLRADDKEWIKIKLEIPEVNRITVVDAGLTEIPSGSETVIGIWPMYKSQVPKIIKKLQVLK